MAEKNWVHMKRSFPLKIFDIAEFVLFYFKIPAGYKTYQIA